MKKPVADVMDLPKPKEQLAKNNAAAKKKLGFTAKQRTGKISRRIGA